MTIHSRLLLIFFWLGAPLLYGQSILIDYDYQNPAQSRWADVNGTDTVYHTERVIPVRRERPVQIRVRNVNIEALRPELTLRRGPNADSIITTNVLALFGTVASLAAPAGLDLKTILALKNRGAGPTALLYAPMQVDLDEARAFDRASVTELDDLIRKRMAEHQKWQVVRDQLRQVRYSSFYSKQQAVGQCQTAIRQLAESAQTLLADAQARQLVSQFALENAEYLKFALTMMQYKATTTTTTRGSADGPGFTDFMLAESIRQYQKVINDGLAEQLTTLLTDIVTNYQAIQANTFAATLTSTADRTTDALVIQFYDNQPTTTIRKLVRSESFRVRTPGQVQVLTSFGLSFIAFAQRMQSYGVVGGKVAASDLDLVIPTLAGYFQVFRRSPGAVRLGAHLGVGVPLTESRGVCFQFGPSLAFGRQSALSLNAGVFTGRATRLGAGLNVGDTYAGTLPTATRYEWGYQAGLSFQFGVRR